MDCDEVDDVSLLQHPLKEDIAVVSAHKRGREGSFGKGGGSYGDWAEASDSAQRLPRPAWVGTTAKLHVALVDMFGSTDQVKARIVDAGTTKLFGLDLYTVILLILILMLVLAGFYFYHGGTWKKFQEDPKAALLTGAGEATQALEGEIKSPIDQRIKRITIL